MQTVSSIYWLHHQTLTLGQLRWPCPCSNTQSFDDPSSHLLSFIQSFAPQIFCNLFCRPSQWLRHTKLGACTIGPPYRETERLTAPVGLSVSFITANIELSARLPVVQCCHMIVTATGPSNAHIVAAWSSVFVLSLTLTFWRLMSTIVVVPHR